MATAAPAQPGAVMALPFVASAHEHVEPAATITVTPGAAEQVINPIDIPAYGYIRSIFLEVVGSGGVGGAAVADSPWNFFTSIALQDVNGANIFGPLDGYATFLTSLYGGYANDQDPGNMPGFVGAAPNMVFGLRIPVEITHHDALGALSNQNAAANYKLNLSVNTLANMMGAPNPIPAFTIRVWLEAWTLPAPVDGRGRPQAQVPPMLGTGQYWSTRTQAVVLGANTVALTRVGNLIRTLIFVSRTAAGVRSDTVFPEPYRFDWDGMTIENASQFYKIASNSEKVNGIAFVRPAGVFVIPFNHSGPHQANGGDSPSLWLPTTQSSRLELSGTFAAAGTVQVLTNEVAPVEQDQAERYQEHSGSGWQGGQVAVTPYAR